MPGGRGRTAIPHDMPSIRCITFDWGDTLSASTGMPYAAAQLQAVTRLAADLHALTGALPSGWTEHVLADIDAAWLATGDPVRNPEHREMDFLGMLERWLGAADAISADPPRLAQAVRTFQAGLTEVIALYAESTPVLSLLKARGMRIGILSHVPYPPEACRGWFERTGLAPYIDFYSFSSEVGYIKPDPRHFQHALAQAKCPPAEVLHVGDHPLRDIQGAQAMGMKTCLRVTEGIHAPELMRSCTPDMSILRIGQLHAALSGFLTPVAAKRPSP